MKTLTKILGLTLALSVSAACGEPADEPSEPEAITKEEARALGGKSDHIDWCDYLGWYGDGICDDFCPEPDPDCVDTCTSDADCPDGYCEHFASCLGTNCPPPPPSQCVPADCDDGSQLHPLCDIRPVCEDGQVSAVINGCFQCVDARSCEAPTPPSCDDGTPALCTVEPPTCADGEIVAVINHCYSCVDPNTCEPPAPESCDDGSQLHPLCDIVPVCEDSEVAAVINGCFECVDADTCQPNEGRMCGGIAGLQCPDGQVCQMDVGMCNVADAAGTCVFGGDVCPANYAPVCGCDGNTYSNECMATSVGVGIDHEGECDTSDQCGGILGLTCDDGEFCAYDDSAMCGAADQLGTCMPRPEACITLYDPVCGCDGNTYSNSCFAASAGVSVAADGECAP